MLKKFKWKGDTLTNYIKIGIKSVEREINSTANNIFAMEHVLITAIAVITNNDRMYDYVTVCFNEKRDYFVNKCHIPLVKYHDLYFPSDRISLFNNMIEVIDHRNDDAYVNLHPEYFKGHKDIDDVILKWCTKLLEELHDLERPTGMGGLYHACYAMYN